jgi:hypothetical protein
VNWRAVVQDCFVLQASVLACEHLRSNPVKGKAVPLQALRVPGGGGSQISRQ